MAAARQNVPSWPSLYNPGLEILHIEHNAPVQPGAAYLYHAKDIFRFTLYWTLAFYTPIFLVCGAYAFWNYSFPPSPRLTGSQNVRDSAYQLSSMASKPELPNSAAPLIQPTKPPKTNERRSRVAFALIVLLTFLTSSVAGAVIASAISGFVAAGLYKAANFNMSTWIPFLLAVIQVVIGLLRYAQYSFCSFLLMLSGKHMAFNYRDNIISVPGSTNIFLAIPCGYIAYNMHQFCACQSRFHLPEHIETLSHASCLHHIYAVPTLYLSF
ncbi:hypothetical protein B0H34DRAFT_655275 [Crassisporium funariophilum]|nr:hypothetical protein B0H34DRAFT_655275 [Crassisporium funariophilum]